MANYYWLCNECGKPARQTDSHVIIPKQLNNNSRKIFCNDCWPSVEQNPEILKKHIVGDKPRKRKQQSNTFNKRK